MLESLARENIGVAEKAFLRRLRHAQGHELLESVTFLRHLGVSGTMIRKLQLAPEDIALSTLQKLLYNDKLNFKGLSLRQSAESLSHILGISALGKRIKSGSLWLKKIYVVITVIAWPPGVTAIYMRDWKSNTSSPL